MVAFLIGGAVGVAGYIYGARFVTAAVAYVRGKLGV
jgi:hypothetical protein